METPQPLSPKSPKTPLPGEYGVAGFVKPKSFDDMILMETNKKRDVNF